MNPRKLPLALTLLLAAALALPGCEVLGRLPKDLASLESPQRGNAAIELLSARVAKVSDGDTIRVILEDGREEKIRFIGVDTPESTRLKEPYGTEASAYTKRELAGRRVWLETDVGLRDRYERMLAYVWLEPPTNIDEQQIREKMFNARLLVEGYGQVMTVPPNVAYAARFLPLQAEARRDSRGLWALPAEDRSHDRPATREREADDAR